MRVIALCAVFLIEYVFADNPFKQVNIGVLRIEYPQNRTISSSEDEPRPLLFINANYGKLDLTVQIDTDDIVPSNYEIFSTKGGFRIALKVLAKRKDSDEAPSWRPKTRIAMKIQPKTPFSEVIDFIFADYVTPRDRRFRELRTEASVDLWNSIMDALIARQVKVHDVTTQCFDEGKLTTFLKVANSERLRITATRNGQLSDEFNRHPVVQKLDDLMVPDEITSQVTDEALLELKGSRTGLGRAPKITLSAARRYLQPAIDGKMESRALYLKASFVWNTEVFINGVPLKRRPPRFGEVEINTGLGGPKRKIHYTIFTGNEFRLFVSPGAVSFYNQWW